MACRNTPSTFKDLEISQKRKKYPEKILKFVISICLNAEIGSLANLQFWEFGLCYLNIWMQLVQIWGKLSIYTTYLVNSVVPACFSPLVLTLY